MNTETNNITKLLESIYILEQSFDGIQVRGTLVLGTHNALLFDTLILPEQSAKIAPLCRDRELVVVYSHADWDHVWGTCGLSPVHVIAHEECVERFNDKADVEQTLNEYRLKHKE